MKQFKPWLVLLLVFVAGVAAGVFATRAVVRHVIRQAVGNPDAVRARIERMMVRKLDLDPAQQAKAHAVLLKAHNQIKDLRREFQPRFVAILDGSQADIAAALTPGQRLKLERFRKEHQFLWRAEAR